MIIHRCEQRTPEWFEARLGRLTASVAGHVTAKGRGKEESVKRRDLRWQLALERWNGKPLKSGDFQSAAMKRGIELEPEARAMYEAVTGRMVEEIGFVSSETDMIGASPDAVELGGDRIVHAVELKCPEWAAHHEYLTTRKIGKDYEAQITHALWVTGADTLDWMSYNPDFKGKLQTVLISVTRESWQEAIDAYAVAARAFLAEVDELVSQLERMAA